MARDIDEILAAFPAGRRREIEKRTATLMADELQKLRPAKSLSVAQKQISEIEK